MSKGIKVNNGHVNEVATQIETAKKLFSSCSVSSTGF